MKSQDSEFHHHEETVMNGSWRWQWLAILALACITAGSARAQDASVKLAVHGDKGPVVQIESGTLRGVYLGPAAVFKGIPYARPPLGVLRWESPQPVAPWRGVRNATQPGSPCIQEEAGLTPFLSPLSKAYGASFVGEPVRSSEDCLYLNVWAPVWPPQQSLPVMVWLHGGSHVAGSGTQTTYDGASLASHGVLIVTINYRLGVLGFLCHPELTAKSPHHSSGNYGLLDQLAALAWVQRNIAQFGGDPGNVTLFGESAGAIDAGTLMASPLSSGLFRRVISESGPAFGVGPAQTLSQAEAFGTAVGELASGDPHVTPLDRLRMLPALEVVKLAARAAKTQFKGFAIASSTVDGWVLPQPPQKAFVTGSIQKVDLLVGLNGRELSAFRVGAAAATKPLGNQEKGGAFEAVKKFEDAARPFYGAWTKPAIALYLGKILVHRDAALDQAANDILVACPVGAMAALTVAAGQRAFVYRFDRTIPGKGEADLGAFHSLEIPYVFGAFQDPSWRWLPFGSADFRLSDSIQAYWTNFAKTGDPNSSGLPNWPAWTDGEKAFLEIDKNGKISGQRNFPPLFSSLSAEDLRNRLKTE